VPTALSSAAQKLLQGLLQGKSLRELAPAGDPARAEVEAYLSSGVGSAKAKPKARARAKAPARPPAPAAAGHAVAYSDGASRGNPGPAAIGFLILDADGAELAAEGRRIGKTTNNVAEYRGAIAALERASQLGLRDVELRMDSELVVKQINGEYRVKQPALADLKAQVDSLLAGFRRWTVRHVRRAENSETDRLANEALDAA
jgi:ribonuclease HI